MFESSVPVRKETTGAAPQIAPEETRQIAPPMDIYETKEELVVVTDLPGVDKASVDVRVDNDILTIHAKPNYEPRGRAVIEEFDLLEFYRQFELPETVVQDRIQAEMKHGVLTIRLPKAEKAKPKQIEVKVK